MLLQTPTAPWTRTRTHVFVILAYLAGAFLLYSRLWTDMEHGYLLNSMQDQNMFEWFFAVAAAQPGDALVSTLQNFPLGVNMMANTSVLGLGIPLAPVTWLFGPTVTWAIVLTGGVAGSAAAWYWVLSKHIVKSTAGAAIGGAFCAFAPPMISHANAHPNFVALFVIPFIVSRLIVLPRNPVRHGVILGILVAYQIFLGEEPLLIAATALVVYALVRREVLTTALGKGLGIAGLVTLTIVAYPLWTQFFGPQSYTSMGHGGAGNDLASMTTFATDSVAGDAQAAAKVAINPTEENAFFGWPLVILMVVLGIWLWRNKIARALLITAAVMAVLSLGWDLTIDGDHTGIPLPWLFVSQLPLYESVLGARMSMACVPVIGILLAMACERIGTLGRVSKSPSAIAGPDAVPDATAETTKDNQYSRRSGGDARNRTDPGSHRTGTPRHDLAGNATHVPLRLLWFGMLAAVLLPITPTPLAVVQRPATPSFFTEGLWRDYAGPDRSVVFAPPAGPGNALPLHWQTEAGMGFPVAEGYFVGPGKSRKGHYGAVTTATSRLLDKVARTGVVPEIGPVERLQAERDLRFWQAGAVVLGPHERREELYLTCEALFGAGSYVGGVWVWST